MNTRRLLNYLFSIILVASLLLTATSQASAATPTPPAPKGPKTPTHIHKGKITPAERQAASRRLAKNRAASLAAEGISAQGATLLPGQADYFGFTPNYAISPIPASVSIIGDGVGATYNPTLDTLGNVTGAVLAVPATLTSPGSVGSGYTLANTIITVIGGGHTVDSNGQTGCIGTPTISAGVAATTTTPAIPAGAITGIAFAGNCGGFDVNHGIKKFAHTLPQLGVANDLGQAMVIATPTPMTVNGITADFYEIHLQQHSWQFSADLQPTTIRSYVQVLNNVPQGYSYLGPVIIAQSGVPVRIKFVNDLPTGSGGNLFIPVDTTVMGAGMDPRSGLPYPQNRAELHLHGGATPWISDGTPHQWTTPAGEPTTYPEGVSVYNVPDMDGGSEPAGTLTYYYTNQQSARLMFYHDHSYGITRLNVYAGEAAAYVVTDPVEQSLINGTTITSTAPTTSVTVVGGAVTAVNIIDPGSNYTSVPTPITFNGIGTGAAAVATMSAGKITNITVTNGGTGYDATTTVTVPTTSFTPAGGSIPAQEIPLVFQDKTFVDTTDIQRSDPTWGSIHMPMTEGNLWYPHVYMPNQNPYDLMGANATGRWDWGPWFWPPWNVTNPALPNPYAGQTPEEGPTIPSTPNPTIVPEGYMDTSVVNGVAYPVLNLAPQAYRFRILNAANDRYLNLSLFCAKDQTASSSLTPMWNGTTLVSGNMGEVNMVSATPGTGLPANWPTDGRDGGVPDPAAAGPSWVMIGSEGGLLPQPVVIPPTPVGYEYNRRSITVLNVFVKGLYLGPAERADVIVDFSTSPCSRLIVYNDAPAPMPAFDPRNDYYTADPDNTSTGGAPSTQLGFGPNTRTMMQINLTSAPAGAPLDTTNISAALPKAFAATQDAPVVPEPAFNAAMGYNAPTTNYVRIQDKTFSFFNGPITAINVLTGGQNYTTANVTITPAPGDTGTGAAASAVVTPFVLTALNLVKNNATNAGSGTGYTSAPKVTFSGGGGGSGAAGTTTITRVVSKLTLTGAGAGCTAAPLVGFTGGGGGTGALAHAVMVQTSAVPLLYKVQSLVLDWGGSGYTTVPGVSFTGGGCTTIPKASAATTGVVNTVTLTNPGSGYQTLPTVSLTGGGTGAAATLSYIPNVVTAINVTNPGANYAAPPTVLIGGTGTGAKAAPVPITIGLGPKAIQELFDNDYGRMNVTLGVEIPNTNGVNQTTIPYGFADPPTELLQLSNPTSFIGQLGDGTQLWKITHNGVDSHPVHFHMFNIQLLNRVGWDGMVKPPLPQEVGWKETVIMNPLEDAIVAIRAIPLNLPWQLPNSVRALDPSMPLGTTSQFFGQDPSGTPVTVVNQIVNFGWEYVWHCHILGHEENDFMRPMLFSIAPLDPSNLTGAGVSGVARINLSFTDNSINETGFVLKRATSLTGPWTTVATLPAVNGSGTTVTYADKTVKRLTQYYYQLTAINTVGAGNVPGYPTMTSSSNIISIAVKSQ